MQLKKIIKKILFVITLTQNMASMVLHIYSHLNTFLKSTEVE